MANPGYCSWLVTQSVHIALYGFFYRTSMRATNVQGGRPSEDDQVNVRLAASLFILVYAFLCTIVASCLLGGTVAAAVVADNAGANGGSGTGTSETRTRSDNVLRAMEAGGPFNSALASDVPASSCGNPRRPAHAHHGNASQSEPLNAPSSSSRHLGGHRRRRGAQGDNGEAKELITSSHGRKEDISDNDIEVGARHARLDTAHFTDWSLQHDPDNDEDRESNLDTSNTEASESLLGKVIATRDRGESFRRGYKTFFRLTVGMMVGWAYNLWGQVEFRQEELETRFGPALGASVYAVICTALGVCVMVRSADRVDGHERGGISLEQGEPTHEGRHDRSYPAGHGCDNQANRDEEWQKATVMHAQRMLVVVGGVSLMVGWAWEEAFDLTLEGILGNSTDLGAVLAKLALAGAATVAVLGWQLMNSRVGPNGQATAPTQGEANVVTRGGSEQTQSLLAPLIHSTPLSV